MIKIKKLIAQLEEKYPQGKAESWDKQGLQFGDVSHNVRNVLVAADLTTDVFERAVDLQVDMIITHHPFFWEDTKEENFERAPYKKVIYNRLLNTNIAVYSIHTNYDQAKDGTSFNVVTRLGFNNYKSKSVKYSHIIDEPLTAHKLITKLKEEFGIQTVISNIDDKNKTVEKVAILPGAGDILDIYALVEEGAEIIVTSDIKWSDWISLKEQGIKVIEITHAIESVFAEGLADFINTKIKDVNAKYIFAEEIAKL